MAVLESDIRSLFKVITSETMKTVRAGQKTILSPTTVRNLANEISAQAESGSIAKFEQALNKTEKIVDKLGINLDDFNKGLASRIKQLGEQKVKAETEVQELREKNIAAEVKVIREGKEFRIDTQILTRKEIKERTRELQLQIKQTDKREREVVKEREKLLRQDTLSQENKQKIIADEKEITQRRAAIAREQDILGGGQTVDTGGNRLEMPPMLAGFVDALKTPFTAIGEAGLQLKDTIMGIGETFMFLGKGSLVILVKAFRALALILKPIPLAIGAAIAGAVFMIIKFKDKIGEFVDAVKTIPGKIKDFFTEAFGKIKNFISDTIISLQNVFIKLFNGMIKLYNSIPVLDDLPLIEEKKLSTEKADDNLDSQIEANVAKQDFQSMAKEGEEDFKLKEDIKSFMIEELKKMQKPNMNVLDRTNQLENFANFDTGQGQNITNIVKGGTSTNVSNSNSAVQVMNNSKNPDNTLINLNGAVPV